MKRDETGRTKVKRWPGACRIGDLIISPTDGGFLLRRVLARPAYGPWWEPVDVEVGRDAAIQRAHELAKPLNSRVWMYEDGKVWQLASHEEPSNKVKLNQHPQDVPEPRGDNAPEGPKD